MMDVGERKMEPYRSSLHLYTFDLHDIIAHPELAELRPVIVLVFAGKIISKRLLLQPLLKMRIIPIIFGIISNLASSREQLAEIRKLISVFSGFGQVPHSSLSGTLDGRYAKSLLNSLCEPGNDSKDLAQMFRRKFGEKKLSGSCLYVSCEPGSMSFSSEKTGLTSLQFPAVGAYRAKRRA